MAKGDGWQREMGGKGRWVAKGDGWQREMGGQNEYGWLRLVARLLATAGSSLGSNPEKIQNGRYKEWPGHFSPLEKNLKRIRTMFKQTSLGGALLMLVLASGRKEKLSKTVIEPVLLLGMEGGLLLLHKHGQLMIKGGVQHQVQDSGSSGHCLLLLHQHFMRQMLIGPFPRPIPSKKMLEIQTSLAQS